MTCSSFFRLTDFAIAPTNQLALQNNVVECWGYGGQQPWPPSLLGSALRLDLDQSGMGSHDSASLLDHPRLSRSVSDDDTSIVPDSDPVTHMLEYRRTSMLHTSTLHKEEKINLNQDATELSDSDEPIGRETGPRRIILSGMFSSSPPHLITIWYSLQTMFR